MASSPSSWPPLTFPPAPFLSYAAVEEGGEGWSPSPSPSGPFTLSHGARKGGGWPPYLCPGPPHLPPCPLLSHAAGEEGGEVGSPHLPPWPLYALTRGDEEGRVASLPSSWPPHLPPCPLPLPRCGRGRGRGLVPLTQWSHGLGTYPMRNLGF